MIFAILIISRQTTLYLFNFSERFATWYIIAIVKIRPMKAITNTRLADAGVDMSHLPIIVPASIYSFLHESMSERASTGSVVPSQPYFFHIATEEKKSHHEYHQLILHVVVALLFTVLVVLEEERFSTTIFDRHQVY